ncbi:MAG: SsrA-binding protein [Gemmataceae bacterium]
MAAKKSEGGEKLICTNRRAFRNYHILDRLECGIALMGTEVKSLRESGANIDDAYARVTDGEVWLVNADIPPYSLGHQLNHEPKRKRKLLLHRAEIAKFAAKATQRGMTLIPLRMYFKRGKAKVELAVARGKHLYDKRQELKKAEARQEIERALRRRR